MLPNNYVPKLQNDVARAKEAEDQNLVKEHAYSITNVVKLKLSNSGEIHKLIRMRNPWGNAKEWTGNWNDQDDVWDKISDEKKTSLGMTEKWDGEFFMSLNDFVRYFDQLEICHLPTPNKSRMFHFHGFWELQDEVNHGNYGTVID